MENKYFEKISNYYDKDACNYEEKQCENLTINRIRDDFRAKVLQFKMPKKVLEIGVGVGLDIVYFAEKFPDTDFYGIDISTEMISLAEQRVKELKLNNVFLHKTSTDEMKDIFTDIKFDLVYVFFGALNTVPSLKKAVNEIDNLLNKNGKIVATFVNKWYFYEFLVHFIKLKFKIAFRRLQTVWGGYSLKYFIPSKLYFPSQIKKEFKTYKLIQKQGYSITHPAWYQDYFRIKLGSFANKLWNFDLFLNKTPFWSWGEYVLFIFEKK